MVQQPEAAAAWQVMAALPEGWLWLGRARTGLGPQAGPAGCHVLAHPGRGLALVDVAPEATPRAEARLRAALQAGGFAYAFSGMLPVVHVRVEPSGLALVTPLLEGGFAAQPELGITRPGWPQALANVLANRPDWSEAEPGAAPPSGGWRRAARWGGAGLALVATFIGGLLVGANIVAVPAAGGGALPAAAPAQAIGPGGAARPEPPLLLPPVAGMQAAVAPPLGFPGAGVAAPAAAATGVGVGVPTGAPIGAPIGAASGSAVASVALPGVAAGGVVEQAMALPPLPEAAPGEPGPAEPLAGEPPSAEPPPARPRSAAARRNLEIDPGCAEAVLRYQQGLALSWSEMAHVRNGCRSVVRR